MKIKTITLQKSKTVGIITKDNRTRFRKIQITAAAELDETDDPVQSYDSLSRYIEDRFKYEEDLK